MMRKVKLDNMSLASILIGLNGVGRHPRVGEMVPV